MGRELVILVGLQASGKSTFYSRHLAGTYLHVSKDAWPRAGKKEARQRALVRAALNADHRVAVDNTNASAEERAPLLAIARETQTPVTGYWFPPDVRGSLRRNALREGRARVPDVGLFATLKRLSPPTPDEGFDKLYRVSIGDTGEFVVEPMPGRAGVLGTGDDRAW